MWRSALQAAENIALTDMGTGSTGLREEVRRDPGVHEPRPSLASSTGQAGLRGRPKGTTESQETKV